MKLEEFRAIVRRIPRGSVMTYAEVAAAAGYPAGARQVVWSLKDPDRMSRGTASSAKGSRFD